MSKVTKLSNPSVEEDSVFHRIELSPMDGLTVTASEKPAAVWIPAGATIHILSKKAVVIDVSEVVEHEDIVSMDAKLRELKQDARKARQNERRARRRLRRGERPVDGDKPKEKDK